MTRPGVGLDRRRSLPSRMLRGWALLLGLVLTTASCAGDDRERLLEGWQLDGRDVPRSEFWLDVGPVHCEWDDALILNLSWPAGDDPARGAGGSFVRDPDGVMDEFTGDPFVRDAELPDDAVDTGYENAAGIELWLAGDLSTAFVVDGDAVEAWPALGGWVCA
jgi:hypothetical protein